MRIKTTAMKFVSDGTNGENVNTDNEDKIIEDNTMETDLETNNEPIMELGNQFLSDGTMIVQPTDIEDDKIINDSKTMSFEEFSEQIIQNVQLKAQQTCQNKNIVKAKNALSDNGPKLPTMLRKATSNNSILAVKCTACNKKFNPYLGNNMQVHPILKVILCQDCLKNQTGNYFVEDSKDQKETLCRWCVDGGRLICCDWCPKSYCKMCIKRNLGPVFLHNILAQSDDIKWSCFACDPSVMETLQAECTRVENNVRQFKANSANKSSHLKATQFRKGSAVKRATSAAATVTVKPPKTARPCTKALAIAAKPPPPLTTHPTPVTKAKPKQSMTAPSTPAIRVKPQLVAATPTTCKSSASSQTQLVQSPQHGQWLANHRSVPDCLQDIEAIQPSQLMPAIAATKRCIEAFYSDIRSVEIEIARVTSLNDVGKMISMFQSVYRHHILSRFGKLQARIVEETDVAAGSAATTASQKQQTQAPPVTISNVTSSASNVTSSASKKKVHRRRKIKSTPAIVTDSIDLTDDVPQEESPVLKAVILVAPQVAPSTVTPLAPVVVDLSDDDDDDNKNEEERCRRLLTNGSHS